MSDRILINAIRDELLSMADLPYKEFNSKLIPTVDTEHIIGIRTPILRKYASQCSKLDKIEEFLSDLPHTYYEENNLHSFIIEKTKDFNKLIEQLDTFLPYIDNWATCDSMKPSIFKKHLPELEKQIPHWLDSSHTYTIRFGIEMLMNFFLDDAFDPKYLKWVSVIRSDEYYVNMMIAWYFATALAKQWDATIPYIETQSLDNWTHNKSIQKARESLRITKEQKTYLNNLKI